MADEITPQTETPTAGTPVVPKAEGTPTISTDDIKGKTPDEIVKFVAESAEAHGATKKQLKDYEDYIAKVKPYIDAITADEALTKQVEDAYQKKMNPEPKKEEPTSEPIAQDTRKAVENSIVSAFETGHNLDKLEGDTKKDMNVKIGQELMELLDPSGTKTYNEVISGVSLEKLPKYLEKAYSLATLPEALKKAREDASGNAGIISSVPSSSPPAEGATMTPAEREVAKRMGVTDERWLENKKQILTRRAEEGR